MQGQKDYSEKLFTNFQLSERVPEDNFYRRLKGVLDLRYLRKQTEEFYGDCGQKSIDPVVFFKLMLVGYLENIISDRALMRHCKMRLDILYFLDYDIDEQLPWHSTLSRTRDLLPERIFVQAFEKVLTMCVQAGMVGGHTQAIDSAPVKANASMDSLELKVPKEELEEHLHKIRHISNEDKKDRDDRDGDNQPQAELPPKRRAKNNKASNEQQQITADPKILKTLESRNKKWRTDQNKRPGAEDPRSKYTSNKTHYSPVDPDARISVKPGKARKLNYASQMAVDTAQHVITYIAAHHADRKDSQDLQQITRTLKKRLHEQGLMWTSLLADTGYSSGDNYAFLNREGMIAYIPPHGTYKGGPDGFIYHKDGDYYECKNGKRATYRKTWTDRLKNNNIKKVYATGRKVCKDCPYKEECIGKGVEKRFNITAFRLEYEEVIDRLGTPLGRIMKGKRQSTVEPVFGTLTQFMGMRKVNTRGIANASKVMLMSAMAYNLKKYLKYIEKPVREIGQGIVRTLFLLFGHYELIPVRYPNRNR